jgi:tetratricopeptide (TPR) repeat protein
LPHRTWRSFELHRQRRFDSNVFPLPPEVLESAREAYRAAATRAPEAYGYLDQICLELGDFQGALEAPTACSSWTAGTSTRPWCAQSPSTASASRIRRSHPSSGRSRSIPATPAQARIWRGCWRDAATPDRRSALRDGHAGSARDALERATSVAPADAEAWSELAELVFERGRRDEARLAYARQLALLPDDAAAHNNLAALLFRSGDVAGARRHVAAAQRLGLAIHPAFLQALAEAERR